MRRLLRLIVAAAIAIVAFTIITAAPASADGKRVALVIGNSAYRNVPGLPNPPNDAGDLAAALNRLGFAVTLITDASFDEMRRSLIALGRDAAGADMAAVYFAGHGMEISGENWLIPVDAELKKDTDALNEAISLRSVMLQVSNTTSLGLIILDACRNNPFAAKMQRSLALRAAVGGGLGVSSPSATYWSPMPRATVPPRSTATAVTAHSPRRSCTISRRRGSRSPSCSAMSAMT